MKTKEGTRKKDYCFLSLSLSPARSSFLSIFHFPNEWRRSYSFNKCICIRFTIRSSSIFIFHRIINYCSLYKNMVIFVSLSIRLFSLVFLFLPLLLLLLSASSFFLFAFAYINLQNTCSKIVSLIADVVQLISSWRLLFKYNISLSLSFSFLSSSSSKERESISAFHAWSHAYQVPSR